MLGAYGQTTTAKNEIEYIPSPSQQWLFPSRLSPLGGGSLLKTRRARASGSSPASDREEFPGSLRCHTGRVSPKKDHKKKKTRGEKKKITYQLRTSTLPTTTTTTTTTTAKKKTKTGHQSGTVVFISNQKKKHVKKTHSTSSAYDLARPSLNKMVDGPHEGLFTSPFSEQIPRRYGQNVFCSPHTLLIPCAQ